MSTLQQLREQARLSVSELARRANVDYKTAKKADDAIGPVQRIKAVSLLAVLNEELGTNYTVADIDDLKLR